MPTLSDVFQAARTLRGTAVRTPVLESTELNNRWGCELFFKVEGLQRTGSFKFRGAYNLVSRLSPEQLTAGLVTSSSGNHAQAVALAARLVGTTATILMPHDAAESKRRATERLGADVVEFDRYHDDPDEVLEDVARRSGRTIVHPYDDPRIVAGAGTVARELLEEVGPLDVLIVPVGGGGLLAGTGLASSDQRPMPRIIGVEPASSDDWARSMAAGSRVRGTVREGVADGQQLPIPGELTFAIAQFYTDQVVVVSDDQIRRAVRTLVDELHVVVEPSGASAFAALLADRVDVRGGRVGVVLSGGNIDVARLTNLLGR
nr:threonine/serine dehydratase [Nocardioides thalensis]